MSNIFDPVEPCLRFKPAKPINRINDKALRDRLIARVKYVNNGTYPGCWEWQGCRHYKDGYGKIKYKGKTLQVHRVAYALFVGDIPKGITVEHICKNRLCCYPGHLVLMSHEENCARK